MTITKFHMIESINRSLHLPKATSSQLFNSLLGIIKETLEGGEAVVISGFGKFSVQNNNNKNGRKPLTYEAGDPAAIRVVTFRCSPVLGKKLNGGGQGQ